MANTTTSPRRISRNLGSAQLDAATKLSGQQKTTDGQMLDQGVTEMAELIKQIIMACGVCGDPQNDEGFCTCGNARWKAMTKGHAADLIVKWHEAEIIAAAGMEDE